MEEKKEELKILDNQKEEKVQEKVYIEDASLPAFIKRIDEDTLEVSTKDGDFVLEDIPYEKIMSTKKRISSIGKEVSVDAFELALISESLKSPQKGELELRKMRGSTIMKLKAAIYKMYDIDSFL